MKKETWILLALLGIGLFRYMKDKKQPEQPKELSLSDVFEMGYQKFGENHIDTVNYAYEEWGKKYGLNKDLVMQNYEIWLRNKKAQN